MSWVGGRPVVGGRTQPRVAPSRPSAPGTLVTSPCLTWPMGGQGTPEDPWTLKTAPGSSEYTMHRAGDELVCQVGSTKLTYQARAIEDLHAWLQGQGDWVPLGGADEQK